MRNLKHGRRGERGQAILLAVVASALVLAGALGLSIDGAQLYAHRQMAQAAADAAAQAGAMSILGGTNTGANAFGTGAFTCSTGDARTPCAYARSDGFGASASDTVGVSFPSSVAGVALSPDFTPAAVTVSVSRQVSATIMRMLGSAATTTVTAKATAAIVQVTSPVPILILHPTLSGALNLQGTPNIQICGGPQRSIQVNSLSSTAVTQGGNAAVDLSKGGPADAAGDCTAGTGSDFGAFGGPTSAGLPSWLTPSGTTEHYLQPSTPLHDPLSSVNPPPHPAAAAAPTALANGVSGCPASPGKPCVLYTPGDYPTGINVKNQTAVFSPGVYYIDANGFSNAANGDIFMCSGCGTSADTGNAGMLVYIASGTVNVGANSSAQMLGSALGSAYKGILFFVNRNSPAQTHQLGGGGNIDMEGTIYATNTNMTATTYQTVSLQGGSGSTTLIKGEIIVSALTMGGNGGITMQLDPSYILPIDQVALVK